MQWLLILLVAVVFMFSTWMSFSEWVNNQWWFLPFNLVLGMVVSAIWVFMVWITDKKEDLYFYSLCWDMVMMFIFYLLPVLFMGVRLDKWGVCGLGLMILGLIVIKVRL